MPVILKIVLLEVRLTQRLKLSPNHIQPPLQLQQTLKKVMLVILLFLPLLLFGNIIIDSIVGEKERKTGEILIAMPISHAQIIIGKSVAVALTISLQVAMWLIILLLAGFHINNPLLVLMFVILTSIPIIGVTSVVAAYAKNYKEAGIGLSIASVSYTHLRAHET